MAVEMNVASTPQERLQERLSDPETVESLNHLLDRLDVIAFSFDAVEGFLRRAEVVIDSLASGLGELRPLLAQDENSELLAKLPQMARAGARLAEVAESPAVDQLLRSGLLEKLGEPQTLESLGTLLDKIELVAFLLQSVDGFLARSESVAESLAEGAADLRGSLPEIDGKHLRQAADRLPDLVEAGEVLAGAGMFERETVQVLGELGRTIAESHRALDRQPRQSVGIFGLLKALRDPQVQNTVLLALDIAERYGAALEKRKTGS